MYQRIRERQLVCQTTAGAPRIAVGVVQAALFGQCCCDFLWRRPAISGCNFTKPHARPALAPQGRVQIARGDCIAVTQDRPQRPKWPPERNGSVAVGRSHALLLLDRRAEWALRG